MVKFTLRRELLFDLSEVVYLFLFKFSQRILNTFARKKVGNDDVLRLEKGENNLILEINIMTTVGSNIGRACRRVGRRKPIRSRQRPARQKKRTSFSKSPEEKDQEIVQTTHVWRS